MIKQDNKDPDWDELMEEAQEMSMKDVARLMIRIGELGHELADMEEKCQFWCDEARKLGYKEE